MTFMRSLDVAAYFKKDLQGYLPSDYPNPRRRPQHKESSMSQDTRTETDSM